MLYLFLEIPFTSQIDKLPETLLVNWQKELRNASSGKVVTFTQLNHSSWLLSFPHVKASHTKLAVQGLIETWQIMNKWKEQLLVFHGVLIASDTDSQALEEFQERRLHLPRQNKFWATQTAKDLLADNFQFSQWDGGLWELHYFDQPQIPEVHAKFDSLYQLADSCTSGFGKPRLLLAGSLSSSRRVYQRVIKTLNEKNEITHNFYIWAREGEEQNPYLPLYRAFRAWFEFVFSHGFTDQGKEVKPNPDFETSLGSFFHLSPNTDSVAPVEPEDMQDRMVHELLTFLPKQLDQMASGIVIDGWDYISPELKQVLVNFFQDQSLFRFARLIVITALGAETLNSFNTLGIQGWKSLQVPEIPNPFSPDYQQLDDTSRLLLDILHIIDGVGTLEELAEYAELFSINKLLVPQIMKELESAGFLYSSDIPSATITLSPKQETHKQIANLQLQNRNSTDCFLEPQILHISKWSNNWLLLVDLLFQISLTGNLNVLEEFLKSLELRNLAYQEDRPSLEYLIRLVQIEVRLSRGKFEEADRAIQALEQLETPIHTPILEGYRKLLNSKISYILHRLDTAVHDVKLCLVIFQKEQHQFGRYLGMVLYGEIMLAKNKLQDAKEYFQIATRQAEDIGIPYLTLVSKYFEILSNCSLGYHSRSLQMFELGKGLDHDFYQAGFTRLSFSLRFMWVRTLQILGDYPHSNQLLKEILEDLQKKTKKINYTLQIDKWLDLFTLWYARNLVMIGDPEGMHILQSQFQDFPEKPLFLSDAYYRVANYTQALVVLSEHSTEVSFTIPLIPWRPQPLSGYSFLEDHYIGFGVGHTIVENLTMGLSGLILSALGDQEKATTMLFQLCRERTLAKGDPCHHWYLSWYEQVLEKMNNTEFESKVDDHSTVLGRAIKAMQERSAKIEDPAHRRLYLTKEIVNKTLIEKGRSHNLI